MKTLLASILGGCALLFFLTGCSTTFTPYIGQQQFWPTAPGALAHTNAGIMVYFSWPEKPYTLLGALVGDDMSEYGLALEAKSRGADAIIIRDVQTTTAGAYTTPGVASSYASGHFSTTTFSPTVTLPIQSTLTSAWAIKWKDPTQDEIDRLQVLLAALAKHPAGGNIGSSEVPILLTEDQVVIATTAAQAKLNALTQTNGTPAPNAPKH